MKITSTHLHKKNRKLFELYQGQRAAQSELHNDNVKATKILSKLTINNVIKIKVTTYELKVVGLNMWK